MQTRAISHFLEHPTAARPRSLIHAVRFRWRFNFWTVLRRSMPDACRRLRTVATVQHGVSATMPVVITGA